MRLAGKGILENLIVKACQAITDSGMWNGIFNVQTPVPIPH